MYESKEASELANENKREIVREQQWEVVARDDFLNSFSSDYKEDKTSSLSVEYEVDKQLLDFLDSRVPVKREQELINVN